MKVGTLVWVIAVVFAIPAFADAFLQHARPGAGATVAEAPTEIALEFTESLEPSFSGVDVIDASGASLESAAPAINRTSVGVPLKPLKPGTYRARWHAVSVDTHRTERSFRFTVRP
jgi:methionine-rich copper-binding protein CopC